MAKSTFNPTMQGGFTPNSDNPMSDPLDIFPKASRERVSSLREQFESRVKTPTDLFWEGGARSEGFSVNTGDGAGFRNREIQLLRERIAKGQAGASNISGYESGGKTVAQIQAIADGPKTPKTFSTLGFTTGPAGSIESLLARKQIENIKNTELAARVDQYIAIVKMGDALDDQSRSELMELYRSGAKSADIAKKLKDAQEGTGIYGERVKNKDQAKRSFDTRAGDNRLGVF